MNKAFRFALLVGVACCVSSSSTPNVACALQLCNILDGGSCPTPGGSLPCYWKGSGNGLCTCDRDTLTWVCSDF
jgi:hypothetical protein